MSALHYPCSCLPAPFKALISLLTFCFPFFACTQREGISILLCAFVSSHQLPKRLASVSQKNLRWDLITKHWGKTVWQWMQMHLFFVSSITTLPVHFFFPPAVFFPFISSSFSLCTHPSLPNCVSGCSHTVHCFWPFFLLSSWIITEKLSHCVDSFYSTALQTTALSQPRGTEMSLGWEQGKDGFAFKNMRDKLAKFSHAIGFVDLKMQSIFDVKLLLEVWVVVVVVLWFAWRCCKYYLVSVFHLSELIGPISTNTNVPAAALLQNELFPLHISNYNIKLVFFVTVLKIDQLNCFAITSRSYLFWRPFHLER